MAPLDFHNYRDVAIWTAGVIVFCTIVPLCLGWLHRRSLRRYPNSSWREIMERQRRGDKWN